MVSTLDFESSDPSSNLGGTFPQIFFAKTQAVKYIFIPNNNFKMSVQFSWFLAGKTAEKKLKNQIICAFCVEVF